MPGTISFDYAYVRIVPRVELEEFVNAGVVLFCSERDYLEARVEWDPARVLALFPDADLPLIEEHLRAIPRVAAGGDAAGPIGKLSRRERFHWLVAPKSTILQVSAVHSGTCDDPRAALDRLVRGMAASRSSTTP